MGGRRRRDMSRNMYKGHMDKDNEEGEEGLNVGEGGGQGRGEKWGEMGTTGTKQQ